MVVVRGHDEQRLILAPPGSVRTEPLALAGHGAPGRTTWAPWPQAQHDATHSGASVVTGPRAGRIVWRRHLDGGAVPGGPVIGSDGTIYVVDPGGSLHAVDPDDGSDRWRADTGVGVGGDLAISPLVLPDRDVVAAVTDGLGAWSSTGRPRWTVALDDSSLTSPATADGRRIYVGSRSGMVYAVDVAAHAATLAWRLDLGAGSYGSVVTDGAGRIYQTSTSGLVAIDDDGDHASTAWKAAPDDGLVEVSPGLSSTGIALLGTNGHQEWAYDHDGRLVWKSSREITYSSPSVTFDGLAYVGEHDDRVHVFDVDTGEQVGLFASTVSQVSGKTRVWTSVVVDSEHVAYFGTRTHYLVGVDPDGARLLTVDLGASTSSYPALTDDHALVIGTDDGDLVKVQ